MRVAGYGAYDGLTYLLMDAGWFCALADRELRAGGVYTYDSTNCGAPSSLAGRSKHIGYTVYCCKSGIDGAEQEKETAPDC